MQTKKYRYFRKKYRSLYHEPCLWSRTVNRKWKSHSAWTRCLNSSLLPRPMVKVTVTVKLCNLVYRWKQTWYGWRRQEISFISINSEVQVKSSFCHLDKHAVLNLGIRSNNGVLQSQKNLKPSTALWWSWLKSLGAVTSRDLSEIVNICWIFCLICFKRFGLTSGWNY